MASVSSPSANTQVARQDEIVPDAPTALIFSDRLEGIIPTIGSMIRSTSVPMNIILIGKADINAKAYEHFATRTASFVTMTVEDAQNDLINNAGLNPIWKWDEWHSSSEEGWKNENTIHVAEWDDLHTHAHEHRHIHSQTHMHTHAHDHIDALRHTHARTHARTHENMRACIIGGWDLSL